MKLSTGSVQLSASVLDQVRVNDSPEVILVFDAERDAVGNAQLAVAKEPFIVSKVTMVVVVSQEGSSGPPQGDTVTLSNLLKVRV